jgi:hypothetical protein
MMEMARAPMITPAAKARTGVPQRDRGGWKGVSFDFSGDGGWSVGRQGHSPHHAHHESLNNLTPADVYFGRGQAILQERERIKRQTIQHRRLLHQQQAA